MAFWVGRNLQQAKWSRFTFSLKKNRLNVSARILRQDLTRSLRCANEFILFARKNASARRKKQLTTVSRRQGCGAHPFTLAASRRILYDVAIFFRLLGRLAS